MSGWRTWEFAVALLLAELYPSSLLLVAAYGLCDDVVQILSGFLLGAYIDRTERLRSATLMYAAQHVLVALSCAAAAGAFFTSPGSAARDGLSALVLVFGALAGAGSAGSSLSVENDWVVTLCGADSIALTRLNSRMRAVDLSCLLLAPLAASFLLQYAGARLFLLVFALFNVAAFVPEALLLRRAQLKSSALAAPRAPPPPGGAAAGAAAPARPPALCARLCGPLWLYVRQRVVAAMLALALLYLTVLSMGFLMTAYLHAEGTSDVVISAFRGAGALSGISSTLVFPFLARALGLPIVAAAALFFQLACIGAGALPLSLSALGLVSALPARDALLLLLQTGVALSRFGLWLADLAINQMIQESVAPHELGAVQGAQRSACAIFDLLSYVAGLVWAQPEQFPFLMLGSVAAVAVSTALSLRYVLLPSASADGTRESSAPLIELQAAHTDSSETAPLLTRKSTRKVEAAPGQSAE